MPIIKSSRLYLCYCRIWCVMPWLLVVGCYEHSSRLCVRDEGNCESHNFPHPGCIACCSAPNSRPPTTKALHTICGNNTSIVSSSWWWAYKCLQHVEKIISAIKHSVASSWFSSLRLYYDARTNIHQIHQMLQTVWNELDYRVDVCRITKGAHIYSTFKVGNKKLECCSIK